MVKLLKSLLFSFMLLVVTCVFGFAQEILKITSGAAPAEAVLEPIRPKFEKATGMKLEIKVANSRVAILDLIEGKADLAAIGARLEDVLKVIEKDGIKIDRSQFKTFEVGKDQILVVTNKANPVKSLTAEQLRDIWSGKITNWKAITGKDAPIKIIYRDVKGCITNEVFSQVIMRGEKFTTDVIRGTTYEDILNKLRAEPNSITIIPAGFKDETIHVVETPEISRPLMLVTKGEPQGKVKTFVDFVLREVRK